MMKKAAKEAALASPPVGTIAATIMGLSLSEWASVLAIIYTSILIIRVLFFKPWRRSEVKNATD